MKRLVHLEAVRLCGEKDSLFLAVALFPAGCFRHATGQQTPFLPGASGNQAENAKETLQLSSIQMCSETTGWAATNSDVLRTTDGGGTWQVVTPPLNRKESFGVIEDFVDADQAWVAFGQRAETKVLAPRSGPASNRIRP